MQRISIEWKSHHRALLSSLDAFLEKESFVDVTLAAEGRFVKAHRIVLCACSHYFEELLSENCNKQAIVFLKDVSFADLRALIDYIYRGEVNVSEGQLNGFLYTAESLGIKGLGRARSEGRTRKPETNSFTDVTPVSVAGDDHASETETQPGGSEEQEQQELTDSVQNMAGNPESPASDRISHEMDIEPEQVHEPSPPSSTLQLLPDIQGCVELEQEAAVDVPGPSVILNGIHVQAPKERHHAMSKFQCQFCSRVYRRKNRLVYHIRRECRMAPRLGTDAQGDRFACPICPYRANDQRNLSKHLRNKHAHSTQNHADASLSTHRRFLKRRACKESADAVDQQSAKAPTTTKRRISVKDGTPTSHGIVGVDVKLERIVASRSCEEVEKLMESVQRDPLGRFICPQCPERVYKCVGSLKNHLRSECGIPPGYACPLCPFQTYTKRNLLNHMERRWCKNQRYTRLENGDTTVKARPSKEVKETTSAAYSFPCHLCSFVAQYPVKLADHLLEEHPDRLGQLAPTSPAVEGSSGDGAAVEPSSDEGASVTPAVRKEPTAQTAADCQTLEEEADVSVLPVAASTTDPKPQVKISSDDDVSVMVAVRKTRRMTRQSSEVKPVPHFHI